MSHNIISVDSLTPDVLGKFTTKEYIQYGRGETPPSPSITLDDGQIFPFYDTSPINTIVGATLNQTGDILDSIALPAGKYFFWCNTGAVAQFTGSWWLSYHVLKSGGELYSNMNTVVGNSATEAMKTYTAFTLPSYAILTSATTIIVKAALPAISSRTSTSARYAQTSSFTILKVD